MLPNSIISSKVSIYCAYLMFKQKRFFIFMLIIFLLSLYGCTSSFQLYDGEPLPDKKISLLNTTSDLKIIEIDTILIPAGTRSIKMLPGIHTIKALYEREPSPPIDRTFGFETVSTVKGNIICFEFEALKGRKYLLMPIFEQANRSAGKYGLIILDQSWMPPLFVAPQKIPDWAKQQLKVNKTYSDTLYKLDRYLEGFSEKMDLLSICELIDEGANLDFENFFTWEARIIREKIKVKLSECYLKELQDILTGCKNIGDFYIHNELRNRDVKSKEVFILLFRNDDTPINKHALMLLSGYKDTNAIPYFIRATNSDNECYRYLAVDALGEFESKIVVPVLISSLHDDNSPDVRRLSAKLLGSIGDSSADSVLVKSLADLDGNVKWEALVALGKLNNSKAIPYLIDSVKFGTKQAIRGEAATILVQIDKKINGNSEINVDKNLRMIIDINNFIYNEKSDELINIGPSIIPYLINCLKEKTTILQPGGPCDKAKSKKSISYKTNYDRSFVVEVLSKFDSPEVVGELISLLCDNSYFNSWIIDRKLYHKTVAEYIAEVLTKINTDKSKFYGYLYNGDYKYLTNNIDKISLIKYCKEANKSNCKVVQDKAKRLLLYLNVE